MYHIRPCKLEDLQQVLNLSKQWAREDVTVGYDNVKHTLEGLAKYVDGCFVVAEHEGTVIGYTFGKVKKGNAGPVIPLDEPYLEIFEVYIHPDHRQQGLGKKLVDELMATAEKQQVTRVLVGSSNRRWQDTANFYEALGFKMWYIQMYK